jgi:hypothetical protein
MGTFSPRYVDGQDVQTGDRVLVRSQRKAVVVVICLPGTKEARDWACQEGGFLLEFDDGDAQVWHVPDEDIELLSRRPDQSSR